MRNSRDAARRGRGLRTDGRTDGGSDVRPRPRVGGEGQEREGKRNITKRALLLDTTSCKHARALLAPSPCPSSTHILAVCPGQELHIPYQKNQEIQCCYHFYASCVIKGFKITCRHRARVLGIERRRTRSHLPALSLGRRRPSARTTQNIINHDVLGSTLPSHPSLPLSNITLRPTNEREDERRPTEKEEEAKASPPHFRQSGREQPPSDLVLVHCACSLQHTSLPLSLPFLQSSPPVPVLTRERIPSPFSTPELGRRKCKRAYVPGFRVK